MTGPVLWYVHHHGVGHWRRALAVARRLSREVVLMSSADPPGALPENARFVRLPADFPLDFPPDLGHSAQRAEARGVLHWAPPHHQGLLRRHAAILAEADHARPALAVVDVSVEVAVLLRTSGVPVIAVRLPGQRTDRAHQLGFELADEVLMPVPAHWELQSGLARTLAVGLVSALPGQPPADPAVAANGPVVIMVGRGGSRIDPALCLRIAAEVPERRVRVLGLEAPVARRTRVPRPEGQVRANLVFLGRVPDPAEELAAAAVVLANCGLGTLADTVTARRPLVVLPEDRPFGEQRATGTALAAHREAVVLTEPPVAGGWRTAVEAAIALGPPPLIADGARRFAERIEQRAVVEEAQRRSVGESVDVEAGQRPKMIRFPNGEAIPAGSGTADRRSSRRTDRRAERRADARADRRVRQ